MDAGPFSAIGVLPGFGTGGARLRLLGSLAAEPLHGQRPEDEERHEPDERFGIPEIVALADVESKRL
jgi:hypothetical protein